MFSLILETTLITAVIGLIVRFAMIWFRAKGEITWHEYGVAMAVITVVLAPLVAWIGMQIAISNNITFNQYLNGYEKQTRWEKITCERDGSCEYDYNCDPYIVMVAYECNCSSDKNGTHCSTCYRPETRYHQCPYVTEEWTFVVQTSLDDYTIAAHVFPDNPDKHRWRSYESVPQYVINQAGVGIPPFWAAADTRVRTRHPGPVTKRGSYPNYILASDLTILKQYSNAIEGLKRQNLLPNISIDVHDYYMANKVHFVGVRPEQNGTTGAQWQTAVMYFNEELGPKLFGDLHLVLVGDPKVVDSPDEYSQALKAYWQNRKVWGDNALMKNAIVVVIGTQDGKTISWVRSITGMPLGNESMIEYLDSIPRGSPLTPEFLLGKLPEQFHPDVSKGPHIGLDTTGAIKRIVFGLDHPDTKFIRVSMGGHSKTGGIGPGYLYLKNELRPTPSQENWILFFGILFSSILWIVAALADIDPKHYIATNRFGGYNF
jgi:hypothetical protein